MSEDADSPARTRGAGGIRSSRALSASLAVCNGVGFIILAAFGRWSGRIVGGLYADVSIALPAVTRHVLSLSSTFWVGLLLSGLLVVAAIEFGVRNRPWASGLHVAVGCTQIAALLVYIGVMFWPFFRLLASLRASSP